MNCTLINKRIIDYLEHSLSQEDFADYNLHLESCGSCREHVLKFKNVYGSLDNVKVEVSPFFSTRVIARFNREKDLSEPWIPAAVINFLKPVAAGLLLLTISTFGIFYAQGSFSTVKSTNSPSVATTWANDYYLNTNEDTMVDLIISNEK